MAGPMVARSGMSQSHLRAVHSFAIAIIYSSLFIIITNEIVAENDAQYSPERQVESTTSVSVLPAAHLRPKVSINIRDLAARLSEDIDAVTNMTNCVDKIADYYNEKSKIYTLDGSKLRDNILLEINQLLAQHRAAVNAIADEAEQLVVSHQYVKNLRVNYTDVHRLRNELDPQNESNQQAIDGSGSGSVSNGSASSSSSSFTGPPQFTSINGGTPVPGPPEWQTPFKSIMMQVNKNFGDLPVNTSMSAVHLPLPIYPGLPDIMNGIAWTERLDSVFKKNLANYMHVHHQYYGDHLGFLRTFPAHKWRIPRTDPDLFDARMRPWYLAGVAQPKDVVILVDTSGSMTGLRREIARGVVFEILDTLTNDDFFTVLRFSETVTPVGLPKCNSKQQQVKFFPTLEKQCYSYNPAIIEPLEQREKLECQLFRKQWESRGQYLRDHPDIVLGKNGSYITDEAYQQSIFNITNDIRDSHLLPATSRNIRYLKSNFSMPTAGIANFTHALMAAFELLQAHNRAHQINQMLQQQRGSHCNQVIMLITDGAIRSHDEVFNRYNYPDSPVRVFTYMIGREVGDITHTKAMACKNRGYYTHVINLSEVREQVQKYLPVLVRPNILAQEHQITWTNAYGDETYQVLTDWVLEMKRRERARLMLIEERERLNESINYADNVINIELTNITEYDELPLVDEELRHRAICEDNLADEQIDTGISEELDPLGYHELSCHWASRRADLLVSVTKPVFDPRNTTLVFERVLHKNIWTEKETHVKNAQLLGVAAVDLRIADILYFAPSHMLGVNGYVIIMSPQGFVMHHPDLRALLEDPFDKQSKVLRPYFNAVDLSHVEQVHSGRTASEAQRRTADERMLKLRELALRRVSGTDNLQIKRAFDCRRRLYLRQQTYFYGPIKDTPFSFIVALPQSYGLNRLIAHQKLTEQSINYFKLSEYDLWTLHPDYRYCELGSNTSNSSLANVLQALNMAQSGNLAEISFEDLTTTKPIKMGPGKRIVCDKELFSSLLFDAAATQDHTNCDSDCDHSSFYSCASQSSEEIRSKLATMYGLEMSFLATRSGLTRAKVFHLSPRIRKLAKLFIQRHSRAIDESWYQKTVDWNLRHSEESTVIAAPFNAYIKLIAKLRQRITQRHPDANGTKTNCDASLDTGNLATTQDPSTSSDNLDVVSSSPPSALSSEASFRNEQQNDEPSTNSAYSNTTNDDEFTEADSIDYHAYTSFDFLDLLANSSVHVVATRTIIANRGTKQKAPIAVSGLLYDYATFARRFLNSTSLDIRQVEDSSSNPEQVQICPHSNCPTKCGFRNDSIDCLLVDNNGFIIVGEELVHIGRSLLDYDDRLMQSLVEKKVFHQVNMTDYQAICVRNDQMDQRGPFVAQGFSSPAGSRLAFEPISLSAPLQSILTNMVAISGWLWAMFNSIVLYHSTLMDAGDLFLGDRMQLHRSPVVDAQSSIVNQSLLASLPNKTYLRPCERQTSLYETRITDQYRFYSDSPEYFVTRCGCSGWYVYSAVPRTNLIMLLVNMTSECRLCESAPSTDIQLASNLIPVVPLLSVADVSPSGLVPPLLSSSTPAIQQQSWMLSNKTAEDQVCSMIEKESHLFVRKFDSCLSKHQDESQIHLCGSASSLDPSNGLPIILTLLAIIYSAMTSHLTWRTTATTST